MVTSSDKSINVYNGDEPFVFFSYTSADSPTINSELIFFQELGIRLWHYEDFITEPDYEKVIIDKITNCYQLILFLTRNSAKKENCLKELCLAMNREKKMAIIVLEDIKPTDFLPKFEFTYVTLSCPIIFKYKLDMTRYEKNIKRLLEPIIPKPQTVIDYMEKAAISQYPSESDNNKRWT